MCRYVSNVVTPTRRGLEKVIAAKAARNTARSARGNTGFTHLRAARRATLSRLGGANFFPGVSPGGLPLRTYN